MWVGHACFGSGSKCKSTRPRIQKETNWICAACLSLTLNIWEIVYVIYMLYMLFDGCDLLPYWRTLLYFAGAQKIGLPTSRNTAAKHPLQTPAESKRAAVVLLTHCFLCAGRRPSRASPPAVRCRPFARSFKSPSLAMFSARQTSKEPRSGAAVFLFIKAVVSPWHAALLVLWLSLYRP